jgi:hypothetical protein
VNLNLVVARETIHEGQSLVAGTIINNLVDKRHWKIVFGTGVIEIMKVSADTNSALFFVDRDGVLEDWLLSLMSTLVMGFGP